MTTVSLYRQSSSDNDTFGRMVLNGETIAVTAELPWKGNHPQTSCIPEGLYSCVPHNSPKHPDTWEVAGVPGRSEILIHNANLPSQLEGCIGVGAYFGTLDGKPAVLKSVAAMNKLRELLPDNFYLNVIGVPDNASV